MKRKISFSGLLHNDRLMMVFSLVLAIVVWGVVAYGPSNEQERIISGVPVSVSLGDYATDTMNMKILDEQDMTASVKVFGRRSVVSRLTAQDILLTVDTSSVISPGSYSGLSLRASKNGQLTDFDILSVSPSTASLTCDIWTEATFAVTADIAGITSADETKYQIGTPVVSNNSIMDGSITITGPKTEIDRIASVVAVVKDEASLSATQVFEATLKALDAEGKETDISHCEMNADNAPVAVTVPILFYERIKIPFHLKNAPAAYADNASLVTFTPAYLELWGAEETINAFEAYLGELCTFNFDSLTSDKLKQELKLQIPETLKILDGVESITAKFNLQSITSKKINLNLSNANIEYSNCPAGITIKPVESTLNNITLYGPSNVLRRLKTSDLRVVVDVANNSTTGQKTFVSRITVPNYPNVWVYYGENVQGYELLATVGNS